MSVDVHCDELAVTVGDIGCAFPHSPSNQAGLAAGSPLQMPDPNMHIATLPLRLKGPADVKVSASMLVIPIARSTSETWKRTPG